MLLMLSAAAAAAVQAPPPAPPCKPLTTMTRSEQPARIRPLGDMPPATQLLAVYREVGGCSRPAVLRRTVPPAR